MAACIQLVHRIEDPFEPIAPALTTRLAPLLDADLSVMYRASRLPHGWNLDLFAASARTPEPYREALARFLNAQCGDYTFFYNALRPGKEDRNRVVTIDPREAPPAYHSSPIVRGVMAELDLADKCTNRVLICDGPDLLAWVGGFKTGPFNARQAAVLRDLTGPLRARLKLERQLALGERDRRALFAALDVLDAPAYLMTGHHIEHANPAGRARLGHEASTTRDALERAPHDPTATCLEVTGAGLPPLRLILLPPSGRPGEEPLRDLGREWKLSARQREVMKLLMTGDSNKGIAAKLGCAEVTVEYHLTSIFRKSRTQNRAELFARFWNRRSPSG